MALPNYTIAMTEMTNCPWKQQRNPQKERNYLLQPNFNKPVRSYQSAPILGTTSLMPTILVDHISPCGRCRLLCVISYIQCGAFGILSNFGSTPDILGRLCYSDLDRLGNRTMNCCNLSSQKSLQSIRFVLAIVECSTSPHLLHYLLSI